MGCPRSKITGRDRGLDREVRKLGDACDRQMRSGHRSSNPEVIQTTVYRVVQEALNNAKKHSGTDVVRIELKKGSDDLHLDVRDFGCGFDVGSSRKNAFGLLGMTERVRLHGGELSIQSERDVGTRIIVRLPIPITEISLSFLDLLT